MSIAQKLLKGSIFRNIELAVLLAVTFFMTPFIVHTLGDRLYGFWSLIGVFLGYYGLLDFGLSSATSRYISRHIGANDNDGINAVTSTALTLFSGIAVVAMFLTGIIVIFCPLVINTPSEISLFRKIITLMGLLTAINFPMRVYTGILTSYIRYDQLTIISISRAILTNAAIYYFLSNNYGLMALAIINFTAGILQNIITYLICKRLFPSIKTVLLRFNWQHATDMFSHSWKTFLCQIAELLRFKVDSIIVAGYIGLNVVTHYSIGVRLIDGFSGLVMSTMGMMTPVFSQYEGSGDKEAIKQVLLKSTIFGTMLCTFIGLSLIFYGKPFIARWMGPGFEDAYYVMVILCTSSTLTLISSPGIQLLYGLSKHATFAGIVVTEGIINVLLSILLVKSYGIYGVALGTAIEAIVFKIFILPIYICKVAKVSIHDYITNAMLVPFIKTALALILYFGLINRFVLPSYITIATLATGQALFFIPVAYYLIISKADRYHLDRIIKTAWAAL